MPEIWLNYGITDIVLDIRAENLDQRIDSTDTTLDDSQITERLSGIDLTKPVELAVLHDSPAVRKVISALTALCEQKSVPAPRILADKQTTNLLKPILSQGEFGNLDQIKGGNLIFLAELELDGLFGYETIATRLLRRFGQDSMLSAYAKRKDNLPAPGQATFGTAEAQRFADGFEIQAIELVANSAGISDLTVGHPSKTAAPMSRSFESAVTKDTGRHKSVIISTGKDASNHTLSKSLNSLWSCHAAINNNGLAVLFAESRFGVGSAALQQFVEGRLSVNSLRNPPEYIDGMEDLLFLTEVQKSIQICLVSVLPEFYVKKLGMIPLSGAKLSLEYILKTQGARQKISVISDGARILLR